MDVERFQGDLERIAEAYRVSALVLSTVTARGEALVLNLELVDAGDRRLLWSQTYDGERDRYLDLTREAALDLQRYLRPESRASIEMPRESSPVELAYQRGLYYSNRYNHRHEIEDFNRSFAAFQEALELDPQLANAAAEIAALYEFRMQAGLAPAEGIPQLDIWSCRALAIDAENGRAWAIRSLSESSQGQFGPSVLASGLRGVKHAPDYPLAHIALTFALSSCRLGLEASRQAARLDALYLYGTLMVGNRQACLGRDPGPDVALALSVEPDFPIGLLFQVNGLSAAGRFDDAAALLNRIEPLVDAGRVEPGSFGVVRDTYLVLSNDPSSGVALERMRHVATGGNRFPYWAQWMSPSAIGLLAHGGREDVSEDLLLRLHDAGITMEYDGLLQNPGHGWIRDNPRLAPVVERSRERFEEMLAALDETKAQRELPSYLEAPLAEVRAEMGY